MKEMESKLKDLPLRRPSADLDGRLLREKPERPMQPHWRRQRVSVWATAIVGVMMAVAGFVAGAAWRSGKHTSRPGEPPRVVIQVIYNSPDSRNPFDFTRASHLFPAQEVETTTLKLKTAI
ncbi:MAG: hypothetical protein Q8Q12_16610 [bacterium]|nr:hypothetical protein [bacterium]